MEHEMWAWGSGWLAQNWGRTVLIGLLLFVPMFVGSLAVTAWVLVKLPATYFCDRYPPAFPWAEQHPALRWAALLGKNLLGAALVVLGVLLSLPAVPGQGLLTILLGIMLLDFPGKRRLERRLVSQPRILRAINRLRARFGKPPLVIERRKRKRGGPAEAPPAEAVAPSADPPAPPDRPASSA